MCVDGDGECLYDGVRETIKYTKGERSMGWTLGMAEKNVMVTMR